MLDSSSTPAGDPDLPELLAAWFGETPAPERAAHLLRRLREEAAFRAAFVAEIRLHGMLRTALAGEPRWLELQAELGLLEPTAPPTPDFTRRVSAALARHSALQHRRIQVGWILGLAAALTLAIAVLWLRPRPATSPVAFAVVVQADAAIGGRAANRPVALQSVLPRGPFSLASGRLSLALFNGVRLHLEGPVELDLVSDERIVCRSGRLRVMVPEGAEGFVVETPGASVTDLGTEFGIEVGDGATEVVVYRGQAEVALLSPGGQPQRSQIVGEQEAWRLDPARGQMRSIAPREQLPAPKMALPALALRADYAATVTAARPRHYWRGGALQAGSVADVGSHAAPLHAVGDVTPEPDGSFSFRTDGGASYLIASDSWSPPTEGFALELWFVSEAFKTSVLSVLPTTAAPPSDLCLVELTHRHRTQPVRPGEVRFLYRWPPGGTAGINAFSSDTYSPHRWHHLVVQRRRDMLEVFLDGRLTGTTTLAPDTPTTAVRPIFGRRRERSIDYDPRQFEGRIAEIALYDRPLTPAEISAHAGARLRP